MHCASNEIKDLRGPLPRRNGIPHICVNVFDTGFSLYYQPEPPHAASPHLFLLPCRREHRPTCERLLAGKGATVGFGSADARRLAKQIVSKLTPRPGARSTAMRALPGKACMGCVPLWHEHALPLNT